MEKTLRRVSKLLDFFKKIDTLSNFSKIFYSFQKMNENHEPKGFSSKINVKRCGTVGLVRKAHNLKVDGSSPFIAHFSIFFSFSFFLWRSIPFLDFLVLREANGVKLYNFFKK